MPDPRYPILRIASWTELLSLATLLLNLATVHLQVITSLGGPVHGCAYLIVVIFTLRHPRASPFTRLLALIPGIGGVLALRRLTAPQ
ncbi:DUF3817 domain-containing protein [Actinoplanes derwentensis]|uniref:DUF3817 domain-containing protein n=1 Tax=Actinoplanes derwentensis TaxID=113562 RepID=A0A1H1SKV7_9ACTN|nr:DUF3817 domain-containing protein [Actinoplanes derwentensis]GID83289.1 hypothetical protein Ade03nite_22130 [Actinoplanes derwentensis]SDS47999.1 hypothetical protein SAMN04489716_0875 [Actinoplanes derwentensis]